MTDPTRDHHDGLPNRELRDLLADEEQRTTVSMGMYGEDQETCEQYRQSLVDAIACRKADLADFDRGRGLRAVAKKFGWSPFDVSDRVDYNSATYRGFWGTEAEFRGCYPAPDKGDKDE